MSTINQAQINIPHALLEAAKNDKLSHAYILSGKETGELLDIAKAFIAYLSQENGICLTDPHPDVHIIKPQGLGGQIRIDPLYEMQAQIALSPMSGWMHTVIIESADKMNRDSFNTLLKVLEEPTGRTLFLLLVKNPSQLAPTIRSRCQTIRMSKTDRSEKWREDEQYIALRNLLHESLFKIHQDRDICLIFDLSEKLHRDMSAIKKRRQDDSHRKYLEMIFQIVLYWYRDVTVLKMGPTENIINSDSLDRLNEFIAMDPEAGGFLVIENIYKKTRLMDINVNTRLLMDNLFLDAVGIQRIGETYV